MRIQKLLLLSALLFLPSGCVIGAAINVAGETVETAAEVTGAVVGTTARTTGAVVGGTVDAIIPGDQSKPKKDSKE